MQPSSATNEQDVPVAIIGESFLAIPHSNFNDPGKAYSDTQFKASLEGNALSKVAFVGSTQLTAVVPAGLDPGIYELVVLDPNGRRAELADAFTVLGLPGVDLGLTDGAPASDLSPGTDLAKPLGSDCNTDDECASGHCVEVADNHAKTVCCIQNCSAGESEDGCSSTGSRCID
jgi:hypothetical protein